MRLIARTVDQMPSPIGTVATLIAAYEGSRPLLDFSQGAPNVAPPVAVRRRIAEVAGLPDSYSYTPRGGLIELRSLLADELARSYVADVTPDHVVMTAGCNQAFCVTTSAIADRGDEVILPVPYYFNHEMWLRLEGIRPVYLETAPSYVPDPIAVETLITARTRAIVLVTPSNPTGVTIPPTVLDAFGDIAERHGITLVVDEAYRAFRGTEEPAHHLFSRSSWSQHVVSLYSFSKEFAIPGCRVGAAVGHPALITEMSKLLDCVAICPPRMGQEAAIAGLTGGTEWRRHYAQDVYDKRLRFESVMADEPGGFTLTVAGSFYGWVRHPFGNEPVEAVARRLVNERGVVVLPGTVFSPVDDGHLRFSFGGRSPSQIDELGRRLKE
jgi:aspartate/methionine/tyrosine aminotransferase